MILQIISYSEFARFGLVSKNTVSLSCSAHLLVRKQVRKGMCVSGTMVDVLLLRQFCLQMDCLMNMLSLKDERTNGG